MSTNIAAFLCNICRTHPKHIPYTYNTSLNTPNISAYTEHMADQTLTALYRSPEVANPVNPSAFGYHHGQYILNMQRAYAEYELQGPIPNNNVGWVPAGKLHYACAEHALTIYIVQAAAIAASDASIAAGNGALRESSPAKVQHMLSMTSHSTNSPSRYSMSRIC